MSKAIEINENTLWDNIPDDCTVKYKDVEYQVFYSADGQMAQIHSCEIAPGFVTAHCDCSTPAALAEDCRKYVERRDS